ncbi:MAG: hypothetical protein PHH14_00830 [Candidatus Margulisbacteria bacterium]|nr:hypothetical protein [Candidatus Margulisiibacteriota bacterium]
MKNFSMPSLAIKRTGPDRDNYTIRTVANPDPAHSPLCFFASRKFPELVLGEPENFPTTKEQMEETIYGLPKPVLAL